MMATIEPKATASTEPEAQDLFGALPEQDEQVTARINADFEADLTRSHEVTLTAWHRRPLWEKLIGTVAWILERQQ